MQVKWRFGVVTLRNQIGRGVEARKRGPKPDPAREERQEREKVERQLARAKEENRQLRLIIAAQKRGSSRFRVGHAVTGSVIITILADSWSGPST